MEPKKDNAVRDIIKKNVFTYFNAIFLLLTILLICARSYRSLTFLPVIIGNTLVGIIQQLRAKRILDKLSLISQAKYKIIRGGKEYTLTSDELLANDIICLEAGQQIPADAELIEGDASVNESLLTGESDEVAKAVGSRLMSGSFIVSGRCRARLTAVGENSYIEKLSTKAKEMKEYPSEMVGDIDKIVKVSGIAIIPIGVLLLYQGMVTNHLSFQNAVVSMAGAVLGMIPEGLYLLVTVTLVLSAARLARNQVLLHDMRSTEALARVDVLCVDKTGTITSNQMDVSEIISPSGFAADIYGESPRLLASYVATSPDSNITAKALQEYFPNGQPLNAVNVTPFSSKLKYSQIQTADATYRLGAPELVIDEADFPKYKEIVNAHSGLGKRVLAFAQKTDNGFIPLLFITLTNSLRENVSETFKYFEEQEVRVIVISGDNPVTASEIAQAAGIADADRFLDASKLSSDEDYADAVKKYTVFGRVKPEQKQQLVKALRAEGQRVAMTGDGVNDILAMKEADCSIAMGTGSDAARQAAQVVLLDSDFSHMKQIICEGRRDINNITRSATLFLYKNIFSALLAIFSIVNAFSYPLQPSQVSLVSMFNIGIPAFALALEANMQKQHGRFIKVTLMRSMPAALTSFFSIAGMVIFAHEFSISNADVGIASTFLLSIVGFMILINLSKPMNIYRRIVLTVCIAGFIVCAFCFSDLFSIAAPSYQCLMLAVVFAIAEESLMRNLTLAFEWLYNKTERRKKASKPTAQSAA